MGANSFRTSINIKFDIGKNEFLDRYLPTPSHAESLVGLASGFTDPGANSAHIMVGPYGTGKSLVASIIGGIVSKAVEKSTVDRLVAKIEKVDQHIYEKLSKLQLQERKYIPVTLAGYEGSLSEAIINAVNDELKRNGIDAALSSDKETIIDTIENWKKNFVNTYNAFQEIVQQDKKISVSQWLGLLETQVDEELYWFKRIYSQLTSGASYQTNNSQLFIEKMELLIDILETHNIGIFIMYDEFGRVLQTLDSEDIYRTMQDLQDLAELSVRSNGLMHVLLVSHKNLNQYMQGFNDEYRSEFQRIEKRFTTYFVESDSAAYYRIAEQYLSKFNDVSLFQMANFNDTVSEIRKYNLFEELNQQELERIIVEGTYPIHPVSLFLLPRVSKIFGQNERTLFTFLESKETGGLLNFVEKNSGYYYASNLFDFFFSNQKEENYDEEVFSSLRLYKKIDSKLGRNMKNRNIRQIVQFITLWEVSNSHPINQLTYDFIAFATGIEKNTVLKLLKEAEVNKFVRFNRVLNTWELSEGSSILINELIESEKLQLKIDDKKRLSLLEKMLKKPHFLAAEYNDEKSMTRFMKVRFLLSSELLFNRLSVASEMIEDADGIIYFVLLERIDDYKELQRRLREIENERLIFSIIKNEYSIISSIVDKEIVVKSILNNKNILNEHALLFDELTVLQEELIHQISQLLNQYTSFSNGNQWFSNGKLKRFKNEIMLENFISDIMYSVYQETPLILNESINRMYVNSQQRKALYTVLDGVIDSPDAENLGIEGNGPDYLVYATVLKNNSITLGKLDEIGNSSLRTLRRILVEKLEEKNEGRLDELQNIFICEPFGVRKPLVPLLFVTLLRDKWDQLMFYRNGMFVSAVNSDKIYKMFDEAKEYTYKFHNYSDELVSFMQQICNFTAEFVSESVRDQTLLIKTSSGLLNWLRSLPRVSQITEYVSEEERRFRELIRKTEVNPLDSMQNIFEVLNGNAEKMQRLMESLQSLYDRYSASAESRLFETLSIKSYEEKESYISELKKSGYSPNRLIENLDESSSVKEFLDNYIGISLDNWSDTTYELYEKQLTDDAKAVISNEGQAEFNEDVIKLNYNNKSRIIGVAELSTKSQVVFDNVDRMLKNAGRNVPSNELNYILFKLLDKYME